MKVLLRRNVRKLGEIGEILDVKDGYARNYLLPQGLAIAPTEGNIKRVEDEKAAYLEELSRQRADLETRAKALNGKEITISARANEEGQLYGSVGPAQIAAQLAEDRIFIDTQDIALDEPIRTLDKYDVTIDFGQEVTATIHVWVVPIREAGDEAPTPEVAPQASAEEPAEVETTENE
jgi:large subunit ribosomal protein L9